MLIMPLAHVVGPTPPILPVSACHTNDEPAEKQLNVSLSRYQLDTYDKVSRVYRLNDVDESEESESEEDDLSFTLKTQTMKIESLTLSKLLVLFFFPSSFLPFFFSFFVSFFHLLLLTLLLLVLVLLLLLLPLVYYHY